MPDSNPHADEDSAKIGLSKPALAGAPPRSTYRLQMHREFNFERASAIVPYLARLGVSHVYLSPIQTSQPGSMHGYDIVDHGTINPELGGLDGFRRFSDAAHAAGLSLLCDIVPNHAGIGGSHNAWWLSVLEWGRLSPFAHVFDIDWNRAGSQGKLVAPFLGERYGSALKSGQIRLAFDARTGGFSVWHNEHRFPICPIHYPAILDPAAAIVEGAEAMVSLRHISEALRELSAAIDPQSVDKADELKSRLGALVAEQAVVGPAIDRVVANFNGVAGDAATFGLLHNLLERQAYRLSFWRVSESDLNYRRFFDINTLAGIRAEDPDVFERTHRVIFRLVAERRIDGLRIDHVDGLADPEGYLRRLQSVVGPGFYIVVEKILEPGEALRDWPIAGTTGYEALHALDGLLVEGRSEPLFTRYRDRFGDASREFAESLRDIKSGMLRGSFGSEFETLVDHVKAIADASSYTRDFTRPSFARVVGGMIGRLPVYRSYLAEGEASAEDAELIAATAAELKASIEASDAPTVDYFVEILLGAGDAVEPERVLTVRRLFQQLSGPVMAKSLEDTLFYRDARLVALNEVGGDPTRFGVSLEEFHAANADRLRSWPHSMVATETHDSKRGEDTRSRLFAISELPEEWEKIVELWEEISAGTEAPDAADRYFLLQTIVGAWPLEMLTEPAPETIAAFQMRLDAYIEKALREAKRHSSWLDPNASYEASARALIAAALAADGKFSTRAAPFLRRLAYAGMLNSLARIVLKCTIPGVPDTYQGTEFWDFSLVDPDNRRPVDFEARNAALAAGSVLERLETWTDGRVKQALLARLLADRAAAPDLYGFGDYQPLAASGEASDHIVAFARNRGNETRVVLAGRLLAARRRGGERPFSGTFLTIPAGRWRDVLTDREGDFGSGEIDLGEWLTPLHVSVLRPIG